MNMKTEKWNGHEIRFVEKEPGEWWAVAKGVADALNYSDAEAMTRRLKETHKANLQIDGSLRDFLGEDFKFQSVVSLINEKGIYKAIFNSRKPEAEIFEDWVFEMLKKLREAAGLEGFQVFRMMDVEHQKAAMARVKEKPDVGKSDYMKANEIANRVTSLEYKSDRTLNKDEMPPAWLPFRQKVLDEIVDLMVVNKKYNLRLPETSVILKRFGFR